MNQIRPDKSSNTQTKLARLGRIILTSSVIFMSLYMYCFKQPCGGDCSWPALISQLLCSCGIKTHLFSLRLTLSKECGEGTCRSSLSTFPAWLVHPPLPPSLLADPEIFSCLITGHYKTIVYWLLRPLCPDCTMWYCYVRRSYVIILLQLSRRRRNPGKRRPVAAGRNITPFNLCKNFNDHSWFPPTHSGDGLSLEWTRCQLLCCHYHHQPSQSSVLLSFFPPWPMRVPRSLSFREGPGLHALLPRDNRWASRAPHRTTL